MKKSEWYKTGGLWDLLIALRLYIIVFLLIYPLIFFALLLKYLSPIGIAILGISILLILKFGFFQSRTGSKRFFKISLIVACGIFANFSFKLLISIVHMNLISLFLALFICLGSALYFLIMIIKRPFTKINSWVKSKKLKRSKKRKQFNFRHRFFRNSFIFWLIFSINLITIPYPVYIQEDIASNVVIRQNKSPETEFGIWTYGQSLDDNKKGEDEYIDDKTLQMLADAGIYFVYGITETNFDSQFYSRIMRCNKSGIEVHLSINPKDWRYSNIWSFRDLKKEIETILDMCKESNLLGSPITTFVYDMETLIDTPFPLYGFNPDYISKLNKYYEIQKKFIKFNDFIKTEYNLDVRITSDIFQGVDFQDGDDDLMNLFGLIEDANAEMSYMVYRRDNFGQNEILDHLKFLNDGDIIILNAWKDKGYFCWKDIDCAIRDCRLVLGYPDKTFRLEIWELYHFIESYGIEGLEELVDAICEVDSSDWPLIAILNTYPYSLYWDVIFIGIIIIDSYGPLFRIFYNAY